MLSSVCYPDADQGCYIANDRRQMRVETIITESFCPRSVPCHHSSSLFGSIHEKDRLIQRQHMHQSCPRNPGVRNSLVELPGGERRLHSLSGNMALPPHRGALGQEIEPKRRVIERRKGRK